MNPIKRIASNLLKEVGLLERPDNPVFLFAEKLNWTTFGYCGLADEISVNDYCTSISFITSTIILKQ